MAQVSLCNIRKSFGDNPVLGGVDLTIKDGEFVTLVGPSGCGKSTLLRILAGLELADSGQVVIENSDVSHKRPAERNLAMVFQSYALYPHLTVAENMMTPLKLRDIGAVGRLPFIGPLLKRASYRDLRAQVQKTAETLKIGALLDRKPGQLSGGQRQRAALGRAMVRNPVAFLMDEPLSNLDAALRVHMRAELSELHRRLKATFVYVTHDQAEALTMSDRMAVMMGGRILQVGSPDEVYCNPNCLEVARFVGSPAINTMPGEITETGALRCLDTTLAHLRQANPQPVTIGIRPEHLFPDPSGAHAGIVRHRENLGSDVFLHLHVEAQMNPVVLRANPSHVADISLGSSIRFSANKQAVLLFNEDGSRVEGQFANPAVEVA